MRILHTNIQTFSCCLATERLTCYANAISATNAPTISNICLLNDAIHIDTGTQNTIDFGIFPDAESLLVDYILLENFQINIYKCVKYVLRGAQHKTS